MEDRWVEFGPYFFNLAHVTHFYPYKRKDGYFSLTVHFRTPTRESIVIAFGDEERMRETAREIIKGEWDCEKPKQAQSDSVFGEVGKPIKPLEKQFEADQKGEGHVIKTSA